MEDLAAQLDAHVCAGGCSAWTHTEDVLVAPADVADPRAELAMLATVRDTLAERGLVMLETDPTPRFESGTSAPKPWALRYESRDRPARRGLFGWTDRLR